MRLNEHKKQFIVKLVLEEYDIMIPLDSEKI